MVKYELDNKTTYCIIDTNAVGKRCLVVGKTTCHPEDEYDETKGRIIAYKKAMIKLKQIEIRRLRNKLAIDKVYETVIKRYTDNTNQLEQAKKTKKILEQELTDCISQYV